MYCDSIIHLSESDEEYGKEQSEDGVINYTFLLHNNNNDNNPKTIR